VHLEVLSISANGMECILIGHEWAPEVKDNGGSIDSRQSGAIYLVEPLDDVVTLPVKEFQSALLLCRNHLVYGLTPLCVIDTLPSTLP